MKNVFTLALVITILAGCSHIPDKSVFEPLSLEEMAKIGNKDTLFTQMYMEQMMYSLRLTDEEKAKFSDVTYRDMYKLYEAIMHTQDSAAMKSKRTKWEKEWNKKFGSYPAQADSIIDYWTQKKKSLEKYVSIEFAGLEKTYDRYGYATSVDMGFTFTPLQGAIEEVKFIVRLNEKEYESRGKPNYFVLTIPFDEPVTRYWEPGVREKVYLRDLSTEEFIRDYKMEIEVGGVKQDGVYHTLAGINMPKSVKNYLDGEFLSLRPSYKNLIIKELLNPEYVDKETYRLIGEKEYMQKASPRAFEYLDYANKKGK